MNIFVFGNPDFRPDSLPIRILPKLKKRFPEIRFIIKDPNEEWKIPRKHLCLIDTVVGIKKVTIFHDISVFRKSPRATLHDFDAYANLLLLKKLNKLPDCAIIGLPPHYNSKKAYNETVNLLEKSMPTSLSKNARRKTYRDHKRE